MTDRVHELLTKPKQLRMQLRQKEIAIQSLRESMAPKAIVYDRDKVQTSSGDPMTQFVERLDKLEHEREELFTSYKLALLRLSDTLQSLAEIDSTGATVLQLRYVAQKSWSRVADEMTDIRQQDTNEDIYDSSRWTFRKAKTAYSELDEMLSVGVIECQ